MSPGLPNPAAPRSRAAWLRPLVPAARAISHFFRRSRTPAPRGLESPKVPPEARLQTPAPLTTLDRLLGRGPTLRQAPMRGPRWAFEHRKAPDGVIDRVCVRARPLGLGIKNPGRRAGRVPLANLIRVKWWVAPLLAGKGKAATLLPRRHKAGARIKDSHGRTYIVAAGGNLERP